MEDKFLLFGHNQAAENETERRVFSDMANP